MSRVDDLIAKHCPNGVEFKTLGEVVTPKRGKRLVKNQLEEAGDFAVYQNSMKPLGYYHESNTQAGATFVIVAGAAGEIGFSSNAFWAADDVYFFPETDAVINKYIYHFLLTKQHEISSQVRRASVPRLSIVAIEKLKIPVPPLEIQREIVKVLDTFTKLEAELEAELEARKRQYAYYRDSLLSFPEAGGGVRWVPMGELGEFVRGNGIQKSDLMNEGTPAIHYGQVHTHYGIWADETKSFVGDALAPKLRKAHPGDLVIATTSEDDAAVGKAVAWVGNEDTVVSGDAYIYRHSLDPKYVAYFFQTNDFQSQKKRGITGTKVRRISGDALSKILIPFPDRAHQERISSILDKFDALVNDLSAGLPAELNARRQQYEYYRNKLLTFEEAVP